MPIVERLTETADVAAFPGLSHAVTVTGTLGFISGQVALDKDGNLVGAGDIEIQTRQALTNMDSILTSLGAGWADVVRLNWYIMDAGKAQIVRDVREEFLRPALGDKPNPASSLIQVAGLFMSGVLIEVDAVVSIPN
jgi:enamine deaminase RidA (YjgF/YER057c/UK114 family)